MERNQIITETVARESTRLLCSGGNITHFEQTIIPYVRYQYACVLKFVTKSTCIAMLLETWNVTLMWHKMCVG